MSVLDYIAAMEAYSGDTTGDADIFIPLFQVEATGVCGVVGTCDIPSFQISAAGHTNNDADIELPMLTVYGLEEDTEVGDVDLPLLTVSAEGRGMNEGDCYLPVFTMTGKTACGLYYPINTTYADAAYLSLLSYPNSTLASIASGITSETDQDEIALDVLEWVAANITEDTDTNIYGESDVWGCPLSTYNLGTGDDEDGALLLHALLINAGVSPARVRTCYGTWQDTPVAHTWTIYRRVTDGEWVVLDWTDYTPGDAPNPLYLVKQELDTDYKTVVFYITLGGKFTINQTISVFMRENNGVVELPSLTLEAATVNIATADIELPAMTLEGYSGTVGVIQLPELSSTGSATVAHNEAATCYLPALTATGYTGAIATANLPSLSVSAVAHEHYRGDINLPLLTVSATARADSLATGDIALPSLSVASVGKAGSIANGDIDLSLFRVSAHGYHNYIQGDVNLPMLTVDGDAYEVPTGDGDIDIPMFLVAAYGLNKQRFKNVILQYERYPS